MPALTSLGTTSGSAGATLALTLSINVPAGSTIVVAVCEHGPVTPGTMTDDASHVYTQPETQGFSSNRDLQIFYSDNVSLNSGQKITFTKKTSGDVTIMSAFYLTDINHMTPVDSAVSSKASGTAGTPAITSPSPTNPGEFFVVVGASTASGHTVPDAGWGIGFDSVNDGTFMWMGGQSLLNTGSGTEAWNPSWTVGNWAAIVIAFNVSINIIMIPSNNPRNFHTTMVGY
jgi:hypothetical protein